MTRLLGPDLNSRLAYVPSASTLRNAAGMAAVVYSDAAGTVLANILTYDGTETPGAAISGSSLTVDAQSLIPKFWFPDAVPPVDVVYIRVNGGVPTPANADYDRRVDDTTKRSGGGKESAFTVTATGAATTVDIANGNCCTLTLQASTTLTLTAPVTAAGTVCSLSLYILQDATGSRLVTWPASVKWPSATAPTLSAGANKLDLVILETRDAGTTWIGSLAGLDFR